jgi:large subunit ribosomal protein L2
MVEIKKKKPTSPGQRFKSAVDYSVLTARRSEKSLVQPMRKTGGRNNYGNITSRFRGGGVKRAYRIIDFKRDKDGIPATVKTIEYDPNRSGYIALLAYADGEKRYIVSPEKLKVGQKIFTGEQAEPELGNTLYLKNIPLGTLIHNVEMYPGKGAAIARSAGTYARLTAKEGKYAHVTMPSGEVRKVLINCKATIGQVSNMNHKIVSIGKAGTKRKMGRRPHNRGTSMNPIDHPLGGGEGRSSGGRHPCSPWGQPAKGGKTRKPRNPSNNFIVRRRKK